MLGRPFRCVEQMILLMVERKWERCSCWIVEGVRVSRREDMWRRIRRRVRTLEGVRVNGVAVERKRMDIVKWRVKSW